ncbi:MAG: BamA/TamA family outer membrane protein [Pseudoxanthomonas sp.]
MKFPSFRRLGLCFVLAAAMPAVSAQNAATQSSRSAEPTRERKHAAFKDPQDGKFDISEWLLDRRGFLPVPIVITEPAVGYGGGVALAFFRKPKVPARNTSDGKIHPIAPDIYGAAAMKTENGSEAAGVGASLHFAEDRWRYRGGAAKASFNLDFYTAGALLEPRRIGYNIDGLMSFQQVFRRLGEQDLYLGLSWIYMDLDTRLDLQSDRDFFTDKELSQRSSGLGVSLEYDTRDNPFTPSRGWLGMVDATFYDSAFGSDNKFQGYRGHAFGYLPMFEERLIVGGRIDARAVDGDVPFYRLPYIDLRGIPSARYQDRRVAMLETELRWNLTGRWALIGFLGAGRAWGKRDSFGDASSQVAKGAGFRYLLAKKLGLYSGLDYAWGPEDETFYIQIGSAWR